MSKKHRPRQDRFLPKPGQASADAGGDWVAQCFVVILESLWDGLMAVAVPVWNLVRFVCWDAWQTKK